MCRLKGYNFDRLRKKQFAVDSKLQFTIRGGFRNSIERHEKRKMRVEEAPTCNLNDALSV